MCRLVLVKYWLKITKVEIWVNQYLTNIVSKIYQLVSVKHWLKITNVEIWVKQYLTDMADANWYLTNI